MSSPRLLVEEPDFRIVEDVIGENVVHTLEVRDGRDAMGVEKWRQFKTDSENLRAIFRFLIRLAIDNELLRKEQHA